MKRDIRITAQIAMLGEVPSSLRFVYATEENDSVKVLAVLENSAPENHNECVRTFCTEIQAAYPIGTTFEEEIEVSDDRPWKLNGGGGLVYLRYGEMEGF